MIGNAINFVLMTFVVFSGLGLYVFFNLGESAPHTITIVDKIFAGGILIAWVVLAIVAVVRIF